MRYHALLYTHTCSIHRPRDRAWQMFECKYTAKQEPSQPPAGQSPAVKSRHFFFVPYDMLANLNPWG